MLITNNATILEIGNGGPVYKRFNESSLSRVLSHCGRGFLAVSSDRSILTHEDGTPYSDQELLLANQKNRRELEKDIRAKGLGFISMYGGYGELLPSGDRNYVEDEESKLIPYPGEDKLSFDEFIKIGVELAKKYQQDSVLVAEPVKDENGVPVGLNACYWEHDGDFNYHPGTMHFKNIGFDEMPEYYSKLKKGAHAGKKFTFKESEEIDHDNLNYELWGYLSYRSPSGRRILTQRGELLYQISPYGEAVNLILNGGDIRESVLR